MESFKSLQSYWRRRAYQRLEDLPAAKKMAVVRLGAGGGKTRRRSWKLVMVRPAMKLRQLGVPTPRKFMARFRDAYMDAMLLLSGGGGAAANKSGGGGGMPLWDRRIPRARQVGSRGGDFEKRIMLHLYSSVIATR